MQPKKIYRRRVLQNHSAWASSVLLFLSDRSHAFAVPLTDGRCALFAFGAHPYQLTLGR
jgi:hypothetical protein